MHLPLFHQLIRRRLLFFKTSSTLWNMPTNQPQHIFFIDYDNCHLFFAYPSYFCHLFSHLFFHHYSCTTSFTICHKPPTPFPDHHSLYLLFIPSILAPCPLNLTSCNQRTLVILFFRSSQTFPPFPLTLPIFYVPTCTKLSLHAPGCGVAPFYVRQLPPTATLGLFGAHNSCLP